MTTRALALLRHLLLTLAFCLVVAAIQQFYMPSMRFELHLVYSIATGVPIWATVDFGRLWLTRGSVEDWPAAPAGLLLVVVAIPIGYLTGSLVGDAWFGQSSWSQGSDRIISGALITLLAGTVAIGYFYLRGRSLTLQAQAEAARRQAAESRLRLLQAQLDPHMLFNTLANLRALIAVDAPRAIAMLDRLDGFLRATLDASRRTMQPLAREFALIADYLELMKVRMGSRLRYTLELPPQLGERTVPTLLLQPLVENAIRHGLEPAPQGGTISVRAWLDEGAALLIEVVDDGIGCSEADRAQFRASKTNDSTADRGFGWIQLRERLATAYGENATLRVASADDSEHGLRVLIRIERGRVQPSPSAI